MNNLDIYRSQPRDTKIRLYGRDAGDKNQPNCQRKSTILTYTTSASDTLR